MTFYLVGPSSPVLSVCTLRNTLVSLALLAGSVELCAHAPGGTATPDLHIVAKNRALQQKNAPGFTALLKTSALSLGKTLLGQVRHSLTVSRKARPRAAAVAMQRAACSPDAARPELLPSGHVRHDAVFRPARFSTSPPTQLAPVMPGAARGQALLPAVKECYVAADYHAIFHGNNGKVFCAPHYAFLSRHTLASGSRAAESPAPAASRGLISVLGAASPAAPTAVQKQAEAAVFVATPACFSAPLGRQPACRVDFFGAAGKTAANRFPIDPVSAAELLAHGAMGARNALRGDRSRDNRA